MKALPVKEQIIVSLQKVELGEEDYSQYGQEDEKSHVFNDILLQIQNIKRKGLDYKKIELDFGDGGGGGGDYGAVEDCFYYAMQICKGKMKEAEALRLLQCGDDENE
jgi:hypothetical protein